MKAFPKSCTPFGFLLLCYGVAGAAYGQISSKQFEAQALPALDIEESYDFLQQTTEGLPPRPRDPVIRPRADEIEIDSGWSIEIPADASLPLVTASKELQRYLRDAMHVQVAVKHVAQLAGCTFASRSRTPQLTLIAERCPLPACSPEARDGPGNRRFVDSLAHCADWGNGINTRARLSDDTGAA